MEYNSLSPSTQLTLIIEAVKILIKQPFFWVLAVIASFIIFVGIGMTIIAFVVTDEPIKVAQQQLAYIKEGNFDNAYDLFTDESRKKVSIDYFKTQFEAYANQKDAKVSFQKRRVLNDQARLTGTISKSGLSQPIIYELEFVIDKWRIKSVVF
ncbi:MAG: hypothetical protein U0525_03040 [Patescibacteria group bacterium]